MTFKTVLITTIAVNLLLALNLSNQRERSLQGVEHTVPTHRTTIHKIINLVTENKDLKMVCTVLRCRSLMIPRIKAI